MNEGTTKNPRRVDLRELKALVMAAENHGWPIETGEGPCGGCDLIIPKQTANAPCGGCDVVHKPIRVLDGSCGGCDLIVPDKC